MRDYVLISDSTTDLPVDMVKKMGIGIVPFSYCINNAAKEYYLDERDDVKAFYDELRGGAMPVTSQVNPTSYKEYFEELVKEGKDIIYICFSSGLSGSYQSAVMGREMLLEEYPDANIEVIDSLCASVGEGILLYLAANLKKNGMNMEELAKWIENARHRVRHWFMVEDLFHLSRGGRLSAVGAIVGSALKIKPILTVDEEGKLVVKSKARGSNKALDYIISMLKEEGGALGEQVIVIGHADDPERALKLKEMVMQQGIKEENIILTTVNPIIGSHVGAGMAAIGFLVP